jgi:hypothetical protein
VRTGADPLTVTREQIAAFADLLDQNEPSGSENQLDRCEQLERRSQCARRARACRPEAWPKTDRAVSRGYPHNVMRRLEAAVRSA